MDEITIGDKIYISSKKAAKITGYAKDYVGQLCREGRVEARLVGRNWYVLEKAILEHRFGADESSSNSLNKAEIPESLVNTWQAPRYEVEKPVLVPELDVKKQAIEHNESDSTATIAQMQEAWREWFEDKAPQQTLPDGSQDFKEEYLPVIMQAEVPYVAPTAEAQEDTEVVPATEENRVFITKVGQNSDADNAEQEEIETPVEPIRIERSRTNLAVESLTSRAVTRPTRTTQQAHIRPKKPVSKKRSTLTYTLFGIFCAVVIFTAVVATGNADRLVSGTSLNYGFQGTILDFLEGKRTIKNTF